MFRPPATGREHGKQLLKRKAAPLTEKALLEIRNLRFRAGSRWILDQLELTIGVGEVHALIGTNGTGKSTLACLIMGCQGYRPNEGCIRFDDKRIERLCITERARLGICMAWQEPVRFEGLSVVEYLSLNRPQSDAGRALQMVGLEPGAYLERRVDRSLSGGERKRIELASLLTLQPRLAILDEPDSGIDMLSTQGIIDVIEAFRNRGTAVLLITHREEIALIADRASQICGGRIVCSGLPAEVTNHFQGRRCLLCDGRECTHERT
jgi:Fe-S cluster assembly ATP-binding protein